MWFTHQIQEKIKKIKSPSLAPKIFVWLLNINTATEMTSFECCVGVYLFLYEHTQNISPSLFFLIHHKHRYQWWGAHSHSLMRAIPRRFGSSIIQHDGLHKENTHSKSLQDWAYSSTPQSQGLILFQLLFI